jgi:glutathione peroxidase
LSILNIPSIGIVSTTEYPHMAKTKSVSKTIYPFKATTIEGIEQSMESYRGKVVLIVNTASECGYTPQYTDLEELYKLYRDRGFTVLAFPSNDFGKQEPLSGDELAAYCTMHFRTTFPVFEKSVVKGENAIPLFQFLSNKSKNGKINSAPKWNFHKYLINRKGVVVDYYFPFTKPTSRRVKKGIERLL